MIFTLVLLFMFVGFETADAEYIAANPNESHTAGSKEAPSVLKSEAFEMMYEGWHKLSDSLTLRSNLVSLIDFSQPSTEKRFYLINIETGEIVYQNYVAHGKNSGMLHATKFSNKVSSYQSSLGFYKTAETYFGKHGLSLRLDGLEKDINHLARKRHIVIHQADYAEETFMKKHGRLGRSFGCPALPSDNYKFVIDKIKEGTLLFIYHPSEAYLKKSVLVN